MQSEEFPELEGDAVRSQLVISVLEEFPSVRFDVITFLKDEHADEL